MAKSPDGVIDRMRDIVKSLMDMDGVAAVNLDEPSPGDLARVYNAYLEERKINAALKEKLKAHENCPHGGCQLCLKDAEIFFLKHELHREKNKK